MTVRIHRNTQEAFGIKKKQKRKLLTSIQREKLRQRLSRKYQKDKAVEI